MRCTRIVLALGRLWGFAALCLAAEADELKALIETKDERKLYYSVAFSPNSEVVGAAYTRVPENVWRFSSGARPASIQIYSPTDAQAEAKTIAGGDYDLFRLFQQDETLSNGSKKSGIVYIREAPRRRHVPERINRDEAQIAISNTTDADDAPTYVLSIPSDVLFQGACVLSWKSKLLATTGNAKKSREFGDFHGEVCLWDMESGKRRWRKYWSKGKYGPVAFSAAGDLVAAGGGNVIPNVTVLENGERLVGGGDRFRGRLRIWKADSGDEVFQQDFNGYEIVSLAFSPNGKTLVTGGNNGTIKWWNVETGKSQHSVFMDRPSRKPTERLGDARISDLAYSPEGRFLAVAMGSSNRGGKWGELRILDNETREVKATLLEKHPDVVTCAIFSPDGNKLAAGTADGVFNVWDVSHLEATK